MSNKMNICLVAFYSHYGDNPQARLSDLLRIFELLAKKIFLITSVNNLSHPILHNEKIHLINMEYPRKSRFLLVRMLYFLAAQLEISWHLLRIFPHVDIVFWGISADAFVIPMLLVRLARKKNLIFVGGKGFKEIQLMHSQELFGITGFVLGKLYQLIQEGCFTLSNVIVANSLELLKEPWLGRHRVRLSPFNPIDRFIDTNLFRVSQPLRQRRKLIGYVGKLHIEKGVMNFVESIALILERRSDLEFIIIGDGPEADQIRQIIAENNLTSKIRLTGWVSHDELPFYLNQIQLMVLPSFTEGLPTVVLEAMACGTPVLCTPVGDVTRLIRDGETGFIMENNSPECIVRNIIRALNYPNLEQIVPNARALVEKEFTYKATVEKYRKILADLE